MQKDKSLIKNLPDIRKHKVFEIMSSFDLAVILNPGFSQLCWSYQRFLMDRKPLVHYKYQRNQVFLDDTNIVQLKYESVLNILLILFNYLDILYP